MISINGVTVAYGRYTILDNITIHISETDKIGLVAKNGAGKSTLLEAMMSKYEERRARRQATLTFPTI